MGLNGHSYVAIKCYSSRQTMRNTGMAQLVEFLLWKHETSNFIPGTVPPHLQAQSNPAYTVFWDPWSSACNNQMCLNKETNVCDTGESHNQECENCHRVWGPPTLSSSSNNKKVSEEKSKWKRSRCKLWLEGCSFPDPWPKKLVH